MKFLLVFVSLVALTTVGADKGANDPNLSMVLVKALQGQLKTCMDQNRDLVQRSCQRPGHWSGNGGTWNFEIAIRLVLKTMVLMVTVHIDP